MASYRDIPMNSFAKYVESLRASAPVDSVQNPNGVMSDPLDAAATPVNDAYAKFVAAQSGMGGTVAPGTNVARYEPEAERELQKMREQAVTNAALDKFVAAQNARGVEQGVPVR